MSIFQLDIYGRTKVETAIERCKRFEPKRLERLTDNTMSLLAKYNMTEADAYELCEIYDMLSPVYGFANRGGVGSARTQKTKNYGISEIITQSCGTDC